MRRASICKPEGKGQVFGGVRQNSISDFSVASCATPAYILEENLLRSPGMKTKTRILLVDDNPDLLDVISALLRLKGHEVCTAPNGLEGLRLARQWRPDLVLLDVRLPDVDGFEVCRRIKSDPALVDVFVILLSGEATSAAQKAGGLDTGADEYPTKPVDAEELAARVRTAARLRHTTAALRASEQELRRLSWRIIEAQEAERQRVARDLHDGVNQIIASVKMRLRKIEDSLATANPTASQMLARCDQLLVQALEENRRIAHALRPTDLDELGLAEACRHLCKELEGRSNLQVSCQIEPLAQRSSPTAELNLFRIVQESLANAEEHARATKVSLLMRLRDGRLELVIQDNGRGFDPASARPGQDKRRGIGLTNLHERAAALGGACEVKSAPGQGTTIMVRVPM